jgi:hypothetical protein
MGKISKSEIAEHLWTRTMEYNGIRQKSYTKKKTESTGN